jgi:putative tricarboxylic transport membrane protein
MTDGQGPGQPGTGRRPVGAALTIGVALIGIGALLFWDAARIPNKAGYAGVGPADVPRIVGGGLILLGLLTGLSGVNGTARRAPPQRIGAVLWILCGLALQILLLKPAGFSVASGLLFAFTAAGFGQRRLHITVPIGVLFALAVYGLFDLVLNLNLPAGWLETTIFGG